MDPFNKIIEVMREEGAKYNPPSIFLGEVINPIPNLIIKAGSIQIDKDNIKVADYLINNYERNIDIPLTDVAGTMSNATVGDHGSHTHTISKLALTGKLKFTDTLKKGDIVAVMPTHDRQTYIIICKVVDL